MSEHTNVDPEVLTAHTDIICSTSLERIVTGRNAALQQTESIIHQLAEISALTRSIGGKTALDWAMKQDFRCGCWLMEKRETAMKAIIRNLDRSIWRDLMKRSGMLSLMDAQARDQWYSSLEKDDIPAICEENILSTFKQLHQSKGEVFERGVINVFKGLSWDYKSNSPCKFGKKIIVTGLVKYDRWGFGLSWGWQRDRLADLERMLMILDGKPVPDNRADVTRRLGDHIDANRHSNHYEDEMFVITYFQKGTAHITFRRPDLTEKLNDFIARHYPGMLPSQSSATN
ncbi:restriction endonuclease subunit M [Salmonella enterica subsp. enterica serovar Newport]|nr:restriction endonuclease subunit M [Salmonella enterica subsp. enterica serovar Newport]